MKRVCAKKDNQETVVHVKVPVLIYKKRYCSADCGFIEVNAYYCALFEEPLSTQRVTGKVDKYVTKRCAICRRQEIKEMEI